MRTKATFPIEVGRLVVRRVEVGLHTLAHGRVDIQIDKYMGWIDGVLLVTVDGPTEHVRAYISAVDKWLNEANGDIATKETST